jgi:hypothetical protein
MATRHRTFTFERTDTAGIAAEMSSFAQGADGRRWMNIVPDADETEIHTGSIFWRTLSSRGPVIPQLTWFPTDESASDREPTQVGISHATGRDAMKRLASAGVVAPSEWRLFQDHQKRGILFALDGHVDLEDIVTFAVSALPVFSPFAFEDAYLATFSQQ